MPIISNRHTKDLRTTNFASGLPLTVFDGQITRRNRMPLQWLLTRQTRFAAGHCPPLSALSGRHQHRYPVRPLYMEYKNTYRQKYFVADDGLAKYELYIGEDADPRFKTPDKTSATLPFNHSITPPGVGTKTCKLVTRKRNKYGLVSFNQWPEIMVIDTNGDEDLGVLSAAVDIRAYADSTEGYAIILAVYNAPDRNKADTWEVYAAEDADPTPGVDSPAYTASMVFLGGVAHLRAQIGAYTPGATLHIIVSTKRSTDSERTDATAYQLNLPDAPDLSIYGGGVFGGTIHEKR